MSTLPHLERLATTHNLDNPAHYLRMTLMEGLNMNVRPSVEDIPDRADLITSGMAVIISQTADEARERTEAEAAAQRLLDDAMADTVELVRRHRARLNRRVTSPSDGRVIRQVFALLRAMTQEDAKTTFGSET